MQNLGDQLKKTDDGSWNSKDLEGNVRAGGSDNVNTNSKIDAKPSCLEKGVEHGGVMCPYEDNNGGGNFGEEELVPSDISEHGHGPLSSLETWPSYDSGGLLDQSCSSSYWFNSWT